MSKHMVSLVLAFAVIAPASFAFSARAADDEVKTDVERFQGSWQTILRERKGKLTEIGVRITTFEGTKFRTTDGDGKLVESGTITVDETATPKTYDATLDSPVENKGKVFPGIYRIQGDTWQICVNTDSKGPRPSTFCSKPDAAEQVVVFRRLGTVATKPPQASE